MTDIPSVEFLEASGFILKQYPDGKYWLLMKHDELFIQLNENRTQITLYNEGWVEDRLTQIELINTIQQFKAP